MQILTDAIAACGAERVESAAWEWLDELRSDRAVIVSEALAVDGVDGLADLALAGPGLGGLGTDELGAMLAHLADTESPVAQAA